MLSLLLLVSFIGTGDSWTCELDSGEDRHDYICKELSKAVRCGNVAGPIQGEILLEIENEVKASAMLVCPWETAISEIRVCFVLLALCSTVIGMLGLINESRKQADLQNNTGPFFALLLIISSSFDLVAIRSANSENFNFCNLSDEFAVGEGIENERMECSYFMYYITAYLGFFCAFLVLICSVMVRKWKSGLSLDGL